MKSKYYGKVKRYFEAGLWSLSWVRNAVGKEWITAAEYEEITGEAYPEEDNG